MTTHLDTFANTLLEGWSRGDDLTVDNIASALLSSGLVLAPLELDRGDGRKAHYGTGRQPLDDIAEAGWDAPFAAANVLKYLRRDKQVEDSQTKARWYWRYLGELCRDDNNYPKDVRRRLESMLTANELDILRSK